MAPGGRPRFSPPQAAALLVAGLAVGALAHAAGRTDRPGADPGEVPAPSSDAGTLRVIDARPDAGAPESPAARALREGRPMDVNRASATDLELLPRIGPALAARIVESRRTDGPFARPADLTRVRGIGPRTVEGLRPFVRAGAAPGPGSQPPDGGPAPDR